MKLYPLIFLILLIACNERKLFTSGSIKAGAYQVYYEATGEGEPVLFVHAGLQNHSMWDQQVTALSKSHRVITIDLPYHGKTTGNDTSLLAKDVIRIVLDSLHVSKTSIVGLSMGAAVTQDFMIAYPERVNKVVLMSAGINGIEKAYTLDSVSSSWYPQFSSAMDAKDTVKAARVFTRFWGEGIIAKGDSFTKEASRYVFNTTLQTLWEHRLVSWPHLENHPPAIDKLSHIQLPVLILHGDQELPIIETTSRHLEKMIRGSKRILIREVAHMLNLEKPAEVNRLLIDFLK